ncbi:MAG: c-type cytochrome biogenesis protein CcmI [Hyphomicrobiaceae bacterium]
MLLWLILSVGAFLALGAVLLPIWRGGRATSADPGAAIYRAQLDELAADVKRGVLSESEADASRAEVARRLLAAASDTAAIAKPSSQAGRPVLAAALLALVGVAALGLYRGIGMPNLPDQPLAARLSTPPEGAEIDVLVAKVEEQLRKAPDDGEGWSVIAPVYMRLGRYQDAAGAFANAIRLQGETAERLESFGTATIAAADGIVSETARKALQKAVELDADRVEARFWLATAAEQDGRKDDAVAGYKDILARSEANAPWRPMIEQKLAALTGAPAPQAPGPSAEQVDAAADMTPEDRQKMIETMVAGLAEKLKTDGKNVDGWLRLIRAYTVLQKRDLALKALGDARGALAGDTQALGSVEALAKELGLAS